MFLSLEEEKRHKIVYYVDAGLLNIWEDGLCSMVEVLIFLPCILKSADKLLPVLITIFLFLFFVKKVPM